METHSTSDELSNQSDKSKPSNDIEADYGQEEGEEIVLPKNYKRPPPLGGQVPEQDLNPLDDQLEITGMPDKSHSLAPPRGGNQNAKA